MLIYIRYLVMRSLARTWGIGDTASGAVGALVPILGHFYPQWELQVSDALWQVPVYALAATALFRLLFFAPYELWKEQKLRGDEAETRLALATEAKPNLVLEFMQIMTGDASGVPDKDAMLVFLRLFNRGSLPSVATDFGLSARLKNGSVVAAEIHHFEHTTFGEVRINQADAIYNKGANPILVGGMITGFLTAAFPKGTLTGSLPPLLIVRCADAFGCEAKAEYQVRRESAGIMFAPGITYDPAPPRDDGDR